MGGPQGNLRVALGFLWVLHGETPGEPEDFLRFSLAAQALGEPKDSLGFSLGAPLVLPWEAPGEAEDFLTFSRGAL